MKAELRLKYMMADRAAFKRDALVERFMDWRLWPKDPLPQPHGLSIEDREDVEQELRLALWQAEKCDASQWPVMQATFLEWQEDADLLARTYVGYAGGGVWNAT